MRGRPPLRELVRLGRGVRYPVQVRHGLLRRVRLGQDHQGVDGPLRAARPKIRPPGRARARARAHGPRGRGPAAPAFRSRPSGAARAGRTAPPDREAFHRCRARFRAAGSRHAHRRRAGAHDPRPDHRRRGEGPDRGRGADPAPALRSDQKAQLMAGQPAAAPASLVAGASRGIGLALLERLAARGPAIGTTRGTPPNGPEGAEWASLDVLDASAPGRLAGDLDGRPISLLVCNAGVYLDKAQSLADGFAAPLWAETFA